jgi:hypothetical protein
VLPAVLGGGDAAMITKLLLELIVGIISLPMSVLPTWDPLPGIGDTVASISGCGTSGLCGVKNLFGFLDGYVPLHEAFAVAAAILTAWGALLLYKGIVWVLTKTHILGGSDS